ncbi:hypothetical protein E8E14_011175 [Neopestalotiopsis sp. 37M]|nr:hypothetical protein E8E14_011175 [Neopestalotiopsis sp. 37M]
MMLNLHLAALLVVPISLAFVVLRGVYRAFFHPLAKVPGPRLYAATDIPYLYYVIQGRWPHRLKELHDQYGTAVRYTPRDVSFITAGAWKTIYGHQNNTAKNFAKDYKSYREPKPGQSQIINALESDHKRMRRTLAHAFSEKALRNQEDVMNDYIDRFIAKMTEKASKQETLDIVSWYNFTTFDLIGDLAFGEPFGCLESGGYHPWVAMIFETIRNGVYYQLFQRYPMLKGLAPLVTPAKLIKSFQEHQELTKKTALRRIETGNTEREDFMSYILRHNDEKGLTTGEIIANSSILIIAGSETTATQLSGTTFQLLTNRDKYEKLVSEIRTTFSSKDEITLNSVNNLKYLLAVFDEGFRMYPPVPIGLPRIVPPGGASIEGYWIPQETAVNVPQWSAYQSEHNWKEPQRFVPERWMGDAEFAGDNRDVLQPFSIGPRNCIGRNLAYGEMRLILTHLLWHFDLELMEDSKDWTDQKIWTLWNKGAMHVKLTLVH